MPEGAEQNRSWLVDPLGPTDVRIHVDVGDGVEISEAARAALESLLDELQKSEAEGFAAFPRCPSLWSCGDYSCGLWSCNYLTRKPCFVEVNCQIRPST
jgi:hypothetical protein